MINKVVLVGHVGKEPEVLNVQNTNCTKFSVATTENYKDANGAWQSITDWHSVITWKSTAESCAKYLERGSLVYVEGKLKTRSWVDKNNVTRYNTDIIASTVKFLNKKEAHTQADTIISNNEPIKDDLPF
ncbi:MAG: single-stranded DNA-binding protein [Bacteroidales bacterium]